MADRELATCRRCKRGYVPHASVRRCPFCGTPVELAPAPPRGRDRMMRGNQARAEGGQPEEEE